MTKPITQDILSFGDLLEYEGKDAVVKRISEYGVDINQSIFEIGLGFQYIKELKRRKCRDVKMGEENHYIYVMRPSGEIDIPQYVVYSNNGNRFHFTDGTEILIWDCYMPLIKEIAEHINPDNRCPHCGRRIK